MQSQEFINKINSYKTDGNSALIECISNAYQAFIESSGVLENEQEVDQSISTVPESTGIEGNNDTTVVDAPQEDSPAPVMDQPEPTLETIVGTPDIIEKEIEQEEDKKITPELISKIKTLCSELTTLYKDITGKDFEIDKSDDKADTESDTKSETTSETKSETTDSELTESKPAPMMEDIVLQPEGRDYTVGEDDYSRAFNEVQHVIDTSINYVNTIYESNAVKDEDKILVNVLPRISELLNAYQKSFTKFKQSHSMNYIDTLRSHLNIISNFIRVIVQYDTLVNKTHLQGLTGHVVVKLFMDKFNTEEIVKGLSFNDVDKSGSTYLLTSIFKRLSALTQIFDRELKSHIKHIQDVHA